MRQDTFTTGQNSVENDIARYFSRVAPPSEQETMGQIVLEILSDGRNLNRKAICTKLLSRLDRVSEPEEEKHYHALLGMLFTR
ncbi:regulatory protein YcgZ [Cedecea lapagei]|uniref:regulatory protein YcgZ n=1 Tax=Cedecea lapagei TaxID=158823 RepID=UPI001BCB6A8A|nr:regulatory protein YcgZ [Cedecea lapagei]